MLGFIKYIGGVIFEFAPLLEDKRYGFKITDEQEHQEFLNEIEDGDLFDVNINDDIVVIKSTAWLERSIM